MVDQQARDWAQRLGPRRLGPDPAFECHLKKKFLLHSQLIIDLKIANSCDLKT